VLWIDAIRINQKDIKERASQVRLMKDKFQRAAKVVVWLGEERDDNGSVMELAQELADRYREHLKDGSSLENLLLRDSQLLAEFVAFRVPSQFPRLIAFATIVFLM
jgi:hypothetical protein